MKRVALYLGVAGLAGGLALWIVATAEPPLPPERPPLPGLYTIAAATVDGVDVPDVVGSPFVLRRDGPDLVGAVCPDAATCRRWLDGPAAFRWSLEPVAELDADALLASAMTIRVNKSTITTEGSCRRRLDVATVEHTPQGVQLRRTLSHSGLVEDCADAELADSMTVALTLTRSRADE